MSNTLKLIDDLGNERIKRMKYIEKEGCNNINEYNATHNKKLKHIILLMYGYPDDDYLGYFAINNILSMMTWSEGCGIHLLIITDDIYYIYDEIFLNFENRICTTNSIDTCKKVRRKTLFGITGFKLKKNELVYYDRDSDKASILMYKPEDFIKNKRLQPISKK